MSLFYNVLVILFIIKIRFPKDLSIAYIIRRRYGSPVLHLYRAYEKLSYKCGKLKCDVDFLETCVQQGLIPNFLRFKLYNPGLRHSRLYRNCQLDFLKKELKSKLRALNGLEEKVGELSRQLRQSVSCLDYNHLICLIDKTLQNTVQRVKFVQLKKLKKLGYVSSDGIPHDKMIFNLTDKSLSEIEKAALSKGLRFAISSGSQSFLEHFCSFEKLYRFLGDYDLYDHEGNGNDYFKSSLKHLAFSSFYSKQYESPANITKEELRALKSLASNSDIMVIRPDKGNGVVLLNRDEYVSKMVEILSDKSKFKILDGDVLKIILNKEEKINRYLRKLKAEGVIDDGIYSRLYTSGSRPGVMYGLPKVHKNDCPLRPIMSAIGTFNYNLSKLFVPLLTPLTNNKYSVLDSFSFAKELRDLRLGSCHLASFDVKSLFTNIPLNETIDICVENLFKDQETALNLSKLQFHNLLSMAVKDCFFIFNKQTYVQVDGVAMGSPLGPTLANAFLSHHETTWLEKCPVEFKPLLYRRYVDDTFVVFKEKEHVSKFLNYLNSRHPNMEFTSEEEKDGVLPFLDVSVKNCDGGVFSTSVYRKPTFTGLTTKFSSYIPMAYKINLVLTLVTRAYNICSDYLKLHSELQFLKKLLFNNGFAIRFTERYIGKLLTKLRQPKQSLVTVRKATAYFSLLYRGKSSLTIKKKLTRLLRQFYPQINFRVVFKPNRTIGSLFKLKDSIPAELESNVIYEYKCFRCNANYIGKTTRQLGVRIAEHRGRSIRTGRQIINPSFSGIRDHSLEHDHPLLSSSFAVMARGRSDLELLIKESLLTVRMKPMLSRNDTSFQLLCF